VASSFELAIDVTGRRGEPRLLLHGNQIVLQRP
jgi:hypothetical protein